MTTVEQLVDNITYKLKPYDTSMVSEIQPQTARSYRRIARQAKLLRIPRICAASVQNQLIYGFGAFGIVGASDELIAEEQSAATTNNVTLLVNSLV